ncbi:4'-phosphopantetheinyl transferase superfamily [Lentinula raphanica]|uniref:holo-[acyl-carrier-protein] synthase n=1 Tax=Lentinula raphanica TaxID=153919 RepID=A0AA38P6D4_9AGAR|nr:4'-phosphopantetheinyl transferase superfamily [Lentinula raphanica]KAJ3836965.1 4'-phosphopantetheinyl transferase superfamily [Lentinula raphanica]KAJ3977271.1 4'-phosphopantetheinyl transferase superfamily [Lentinula raphanica]
MQVWAVSYDPPTFTEDLYQKGLLLVDEASSTRIKRFYRREDACRGLIARLLPRLLLKERGVASNMMSFAATEFGKPYITTPGINPPIAYNLSHDNGLIVMAFANGKAHPPAYSIGVDVMKVHRPRRDSYRSFVDTFHEQLTPLEQNLLSPEVPESEGLRRFFWMWTMKEAYTKALGLGLGFDFSRVEFDVIGNIVRVDGQEPKGWKFHRFEVTEAGELYVGVVAEFLEDDFETLVVPETDPKPWFKSFTAAAILERAIQELTQSG